MKVDEDKVDIARMFWEDDWARMAAYDTDAENVEWHVTNCMTYLIQLSEDVVPLYKPAPNIELAGDWNEHEQLLLYRDLLPEAERWGYRPDPGVIVRIKQVFPPKRVRVRRRIVRP